MSVYVYARKTIDIIYFNNLMLFCINSVGTLYKSFIIFKSHSQTSSVKQ